MDPSASYNWIIEKQCTTLSGEHRKIPLNFAMLSLQQAATHSRHTNGSALWCDWNMKLH